MALVTEKVKIAELSKFGFKSDKNEYINWGPRFTDKVNLVPGVEAEFLLYVSDSGKKYVNELKGISKTEVVTPKSEPKLPAKAVEPKAKPPFKAKEDTAMTKSEWQAKDRSQLIGGLSHDAATMAASILNVQPAENVEDALKVYKELLEGMLKIRDEVK